MEDRGWCGDEEDGVEGEGTAATEDEDGVGEDGEGILNANW